MLTLGEKQMNSVSFEIICTLSCVFLEHIALENYKVGKVQICKDWFTFKALIKALS